MELSTLVINPVEGSPSSRAPSIKFFEDQPLCLCEESAYNLYMFMLCSSFCLTRTISGVRNAEMKGMNSEKLDV